MNKKILTFEHIMNYMLLSSCLYSFRHSSVVSNLNTIFARSTAAPPGLQWRNIHYHKPWSWSRTSNQLLSNMPCCDVFRLKYASGEMKGRAAPQSPCPTQDVHANMYAAQSTGVRLRCCDFIERPSTDFWMRMKIITA